MFFSCGDMEYVASLYGELMAFNDFDPFSAYDDDNGFALLMVIIGDWLPGIRSPNMSRDLCPCAPPYDEEDGIRIPRFSRLAMTCFWCYVKPPMLSVKVLTMAIPKW